MKIINDVGTRPNFIKIAPIMREFKKYPDIEAKLIHTGQHYNENMSSYFFRDLEIPEPNYSLGVGSASHSIQTAKIMIEFEKVCLKEKPDMVIVVGDVNSTIASALVATKLNIKVAHIEAGLRSFDRGMPEEINRVVTDAISDYLFVTEKSGIENLKKEGIPDKKIFFTGNVMIDTLVYCLPKIEQSSILEKLSLKKSDYILMTFHRPSNVDSISFMSSLAKFLNKISGKRKIIFPIHPRTQANLNKFNLVQKINKNIITTEPLGYIDFLALTKNAELIITDSGGIQEESTYLGVQCITVRNNTERPITVQVGTNHLVGTDFNKIEGTVYEIIDGKKKKANIPELWDGKASERVVQIILNKLF